MTPSCWSDMCVTLLGVMGWEEQLRSPIEKEGSTEGEGVSGTLSGSPKTLSRDTGDEKGGRN